MDQPANYYSTLGVTKATPDADIRQAYNLLVEHLRARATPDSQLPDSQRMALLDAALHTLLSPDKRKRHDEKLDWHIAKTRLAADRNRDAAMRLKQAQDDAAEAQKSALRAAQETTLEAALRASAEAKRRAELARVEADAAERFRQLREERSQFEDSKAAALQAEEEAAVTQPMELAPQPMSGNKVANPPSRAVGKKVLIGGAVLVVLFFMAYRVLRPATPKPLAPAALAAQPAAPAAALQPAAAVSDPAAQTASVGSSPPKNADTAAPKPQATPVKPAKVDSAKSAELLQYQKVLRRVEEEHPELNPDHAKHRNDLIAFVASRVNTHVREGYPKSKALDIAVRDLETQEQAKRMLEKYQGNKDKPPPEAPQVVLDKGAHQGYDPKCRWVTPEQWSCK